MTTHKILRECFNLPKEDKHLARELIDSLLEAQNDFERVGVEFTYEGFIAWFKRTHEHSLNSNSIDKWPHNMLKAIEGDNLDIIEEAAEKKGLL